MVSLGISGETRETGNPGNTGETPDAFVTSILTSAHRDLPRPDFFESDDTRQKVKSLGNGSNIILGYLARFS